MPGAAASDRWQAADFEQLEPERLDLREHAIQRGAVGERPGQHSVVTAGPSLQGRERGAYRLAQAGRGLGSGTGRRGTAMTRQREAITQETSTSGPAV